MKRFLLVLLIGLASLSLSACRDDKSADIVTTMFPQYDFARQIVGDKMTVSLLTSPGVDIHSYEASSRDMAAIQNAKLFIFTSLEIEPWLNNLANIGGADTVVLNLSQSFIVKDHDHDDDHEHTNTGHSIALSGDDDDHDDDLHYWTDPTTTIQLIEVILASIIAIDPDNAQTYEANAHAYIHEIEDLHEALEDFLLDYEREGSTIFFAGHNAMKAFAERYHLNIVSLFEDFVPDADLTSAQLIQFTEAVRTAGVRYLFIEELVEPKAAMAIVTELTKDGYTLELLELHGYHNVTREDFESGVSYADLMARNLAHLIIALSEESM